MAADPAVVSIDRLPQVMSALARQFVHANRSISLDSIDRLSARAELIQLPIVTASRFRWSFVIEKQTERRFLVFFRRKKPLEVVLDARLSAEIGLFPQSSEPVAGFDWLLCLPPFLVHSRERELFQRYVGDHRATPDNSMLFQLGPPEDRAYLGILDPAKEFRRSEFQVAYTDSGKQIVAKRGQIDARFVKPLTKLVSAMASWQRSPNQYSGTVPLALGTPNQGNAGKTGDVVRIITMLSESYAGLVQALRLSAIEPGDRMAQLMGANPGLRSFEAKVVLRLAPGGELALTDDDDPFQIALTMRPDRGPPRPRMTLTTLIPDYLVSGALRNEMIKAIVANVDGSRFSRSELRKLVPSEEVAALGSDLLANGAAKAVVFRVRRHAKRDDATVNVNIAVFESSTRFGRMVAFVRADFRVEAHELERSLELEADSLRILYAGPIEGSAGELSDDLINYFVRLATVFYRWNGLIK